MQSKGRPTGQSPRPRSIRCLPFGFPFGAAAHRYAAAPPRTDRYLSSPPPLPCCLPPFRLRGNPAAARRPAMTSSTSSSSASRKVRNPQPPPLSPRSIRARGRFDWSFCLPLPCGSDSLLRASWVAGVQALSKIACSRLQKELSEWQVSPPAGFKHRVTDNLQRWHPLPSPPFLAPFLPSSLFMRGRPFSPLSRRAVSSCGVPLLFPPRFDAGPLFFLLFCLRVSISPGEITERYRPPDWSKTRCVGCVWDCSYLRFLVLFY